MREIADGSVSPEVYGRYLRLEEDFVWTAARVYGSWIAASDSRATIAALAGAVAELTGPQASYFTEVTARWPADPVTLAPGSRGARLTEHVLATVEVGGVPAAAVAMFAAETLYRRWCAEAIAEAAPDRDPDVTAWLAMHTDPAFCAQVDWLAAIVDALPPEVADQELDAWFVGMLAAEDEFHDDAYATTEDAR